MRSSRVGPTIDRVMSVSRGAARRDASTNPSDVSRSPQALQSTDQDPPSTTYRRWTASEDAFSRNWVSKLFLAQLSRRSCHHFAAR